MKVAVTLSAEVGAAQQQAYKLERSLSLFSSKKKRASAVYDAVAQGARQVFKENQSSFCHLEEDSYIKHNFIILSKLKNDEI